MILGGVILVLALLHVVTVLLANRAPSESVVRYDIPIFRLRYRLLHLDREMTVPTWFAVILLASCAGMAWAVAAIRRRLRQGDVRSWIIFGMILATLSIDELVAIHEVLSSRVRVALGEWAVGPLFYGWYLPVLAVFGGVGLILIPAWRRLPGTTRWGIAGSLGVFLAGAVGVEAVTGWVVESRGMDDPPVQGGSWDLVALVMAEELIELIGLAALTCVLFAYLRPQLRIDLMPPPAE